MSPIHRDPALTAMVRSDPPSLPGSLSLSLPMLWPAGVSGPPCALPFPHHFTGFQIERRFPFSFGPTINLKALPPLVPTLSYLGVGSENRGVAWANQFDVDQTGSRCANASLRPGYDPSSIAERPVRI